MTNYKNKYNKQSSFYLRNNRGYTLVELLLVLALMGVIILIINSINTLGLKTFTFSSDQTNIQQNLRLATNFITKETRFASDVQILDLSLSEIITEMEKSDNEYHYIYLENNDLKYRYKNKTKSITDTIKDIDFKKNSNNILELNVFGEKNNNNYEIGTEVAILNMPEDNQISNANGAAIRYKYTIPDFPVDEDPNSKWDQYMIFTNNIEIKNGGDKVIGPNTSVTINKQNNNTVKILGNSNISVKELYIKGNLEMGGSGSIGSGSFAGVTYVKGNVKLTGGSNIYGQLYYTGSLDVRDNIKVSATSIRTDKIQFPSISMPQLKNEEWYIERGYSSNTYPKDGMRYYGNSYEFSTSGIYPGSYSDVVMASKGDIIIPGTVSVSGILFAPNGRVITRGSGKFSGIIIAKEVILESASPINFKAFNIEDLPF